MTSLRFDHVHYRSSDFDKTREFYVGIMGATDLGTIDLGPEGHRQPNLQLELGGVTLQEVTS
jgi:catechol 2,3-dioxygenase-like lactoylglutathione lyase family enzyme